MGVVMVYILAPIIGAMISIKLFLIAELWESKRK